MMPERFHGTPPHLPPHPKRLASIYRLPAADQELVGVYSDAVTYIPAPSLMALAAFARLTISRTSAKSCLAS